MANPLQHPEKGELMGCVLITAWGIKLIQLVQEEQPISSQQVIVDSKCFNQAIQILEFSRWLTLPHAWNSSLGSGWARGQGHSHLSLLVGQPHSYQPLQMRYGEEVVYRQQNDGSW